MLRGTIDGKISGDDAWRGSFRRDIVLTNFEGDIVNAVMFGVQDHTGNDAYVGIRINDATSNAGDYAQIYFEENGADNTTAARDYDLDASAEDATRATGATQTDMYWGANSWVDDAEAADNHDAHGTREGTSWEYEFLVPYDAGAEDIDMPDNGVPGFFVRYHDADKVAGKQEFFWEYNANTDSIQIDPNSNAYLALGWSQMQLGAPYVQVVYPEDNANVEGVVNVRIYAEDENANGIDSAFFYRKSISGTKYPFTRIGGTNEWSGTLDVSSLSNGADTLVFEVGDDDGIVMERLVNVVIANGSGAAAPPAVSITSPGAGSVVSGTTTIAFTSSATGASVVTREISIDGSAFVATTTTATHTWNTSSLADGSHTILLKVTDSNGSSTSTNVTTYLVRNIPLVTLVAPAADSVVSGTTVVVFTATPVAPVHTRQHRPLQSIPLIRKK
jgi:hypothetical protein